MRKYSWWLLPNTIKFNVKICLSGQHNNLLTEAIKIFDIKPDFDIKVIHTDNTIKKYNFRFKKRCFHQGEIIRSESRHKSSESYAKRYAAKEACAKALGTGLARGVFWKDIEVQNNKFGKPKIKLHNNALKYLEVLVKNKEYSIEVSLSDEKNYAIANVIIYGNKKK